MRKIAISLSLFLLCVGLFTGCGNGNNSGSTSGNGNGQGSSGADFKSSVNHIVYMIQENRSFDSYFGQLNAYRKGSGLGADVDGLDMVATQPPTNPTRDGSSTIASFKMQSACSENISPSWNESHRQRNVQKPDITNPALNDGFVYTAAGYAIANGLNDTEGKRAMGYYDQTILPYYYSMATNFATSDRWFSPILSKSEPNRLYSFAATSAGNIAVPQTPLTGVKTIFHLLQDANVTWKIYTTSSNNGTYLSYFQPFASDHAANVVPVSQYFADLKNGTLPQVAFIETGPGKDEHPKVDVQTGAAYVASLINALMSSTAWKDSVFILTYDEAGGLYDHVPPVPTVAPDNIPPTLDADNPTNYGDTFTMTGFRVPLIVVSPFARKGYVSHTSMDYTAVLKLIEDRFGLPNLTARDAAQPSMMEFFDVNHPSWTTPPKPPSQPTNAPCYFTSLP